VPAFPHIVLSYLTDSHNHFRMSTLLSSVVDAGTAATYVGVWDDFSKPIILRSTLTLSTFNATILLTALSTGITLTAPRAWHILRFLLYYVFLCRNDERDSPEAESETNIEMQAHEGLMTSQTQQSIPSKPLVLLRNSETSATAWLDYCSLLWKARHEKLLGFKSRRSIIWVSAGLHSLLFIAAGILASQTVVGNSVRSKVTPTCGRWQASQPGSPTSYEQQWNESMKADEYVRHCYSMSNAASRSLGSVFGCDKFNVPSIAITRTDNATCPWATGVCTYNDESAMALDTGNVSLSELGLNCKRCKDVSFRRRSVCAPLDAKQFLIGDGPLGNATPTYLFNFSSALNPYAVPVVLERQNYLLRSMNLGALLRTTLSRLLRFSDDNDISHDPVLVLLTSALGLTFQYPTADPVFDVSEDNVVENPVDGGVAYEATKPLAIIGCDETVQFCSEDLDVCGPWYGLLHPERNSTFHYEYLVDGSESSEETRSEYTDLYAALSVVDTFLMQSTVDRSIAFREGNVALQAARTMVNGHTVGQLSDEQWKIEVHHWFSAAMAKLQHQFFDTIERRSDVDPARMRNVWQEAGLQGALCGTVRFHSSSHLSFSFAGIMIIVICCAIIVVTSYFPTKWIRKLLAVGWVSRTRWGGRWESRLSLWDEAENVALLEKLQSLEHTGRGESDDVSAVELTHGVRK